jgi:HSP20 family protein
MSEELATKTPEKSELARDGNGTQSNQRWLRPRYDVKQLDSGDYTLRVWMPGASKESVSIALEKDTLLICGHREQFRQDGWTPVLQELPEGDYRLSLMLNMSIDGDRIKAHVEDGILTLDLPVAEEAKPREITIN